MFCMIFNFYSYENHISFVWILISPWPDNEETLTTLVPEREAKNRAFLNRSQIAEIEISGLIDEHYDRFISNNVQYLKLNMTDCVKFFANIELFPWYWSINLLIDLNSEKNVDKPIP